ncbi:cathepsin K-like [Eucyclogobius newberryi]|uniref:cathepsin K-like n=1 Tax=Eucyclogobius newberryi TaxID=166745 RepID=UPI003B58EE54
MKSTRTGVVGVWLLALLCVTVWAEFDSRLDQHWELWKKTHQKTYQNEVEEMGRRALWEKNLMQINIHNLEASLGLHTYTMGMNHLGDLTKEEALQKYATLRIPKDFKRTASTFKAKAALVPDSVDWRKHGYVTGVKDQRACGSCWAFSVVGSMEGHLFRTTGKLVDLSPQNLVDCSKENYGCGGGYMTKAFEYVIEHGLESESSYPYEAADGPCRYNSEYVVANCSGYSLVFEQTEEALQEAVANIGPISVGINANPLLYYSSGIFSDPSCDAAIDHGVVAVGYGTDGDTDFWLVKNSWGIGWGEDGYIRIARNQGNMCGIALMATFCNI